MLIDGEAINNGGLGKATERRSHLIWALNDKELFSTWKKKEREKSIIERRNIRKFKVHVPLKRNRVPQGKQKKRQVAEDNAKKGKEKDCQGSLMQA